MRNRTRLSAVFVVVFVLGAGACRQNITHPIYRRPVISSVVVFPTVLGPGDSTMITVFATDPDGDSLVYDWDAYNGLIIKGAHPGYSYIYNIHSASMVFFRSTTWPYPDDTAFVWCSARDQRGGSDSRQVLIFYKN
jgi:hypothetical protein